ncbi:dihydrodipicolinate synthase family protein [Natronosalvus caseinilyticus]|uniref:dihydrodipicolinate synthase family protein n=1 Tax=Natronosalvus caseinilyticus TaxID=2953747 RepID=UPI0028A720F2|nr:dihydrodipicolinate synthase family protein [Natronosalvus caseinilyticus]
MATPIDGTGQGIDETTLADFTRTLIDGGVNGLFPGSSIGEFSSLSTTEHETVVRTVTTAADGDTTVLAGCCGTSVGDVRSKLETAADAGADAAVVVSPYYLNTTQRGLARFFTMIADESPLPLLLYNIPGLTGNEISVDTVATMAEHDAIVGLKDTSGDLIYQHRVIEATPESFAVFNGMTATAAPSLDVGIDGLIAGPANVFPEALAELYAAYDRGDDRTVTRLTRDLVMPLVSAYQDLPTAAAIKYLVQLEGLDLGEPLPPLAPLSGEQRRRLKACHQEVVDAVDVSVVK